MAFYAFAPWPSFGDHREPLLDFCEERGIVGSILIAAEGINGTVAGSRVALDELLGRIRSMPGFENLRPKFSSAERAPFRRMRVRPKKEIVPLGVDDIDALDTGVRVAPTEWDALIAEPDVVVVDTRNHYEVAIGTFDGAIDPGTETFRDFAAWADTHLAADTRIAMFCTGGIRCEKASAYLLRRGFTDVFQLDGGILNYLERVPEGGRWTGDCYVFDERVAVDRHLEPTGHEVCPNCNRALTVEDRTHGAYERGVACGDCAATITDERRARFAERQRQIDLATARGERHLGR